MGKNSINSNICYVKYHLFLRQPYWCGRYSVIQAAVLRRNWILGLEVYYENHEKMIVWSYWSPCSMFCYCCFYINQNPWSNWKVVYFSWLNMRNKTCFFLTLSHYGMFFFKTNRRNSRKQGLFAGYCKSIVIFSTKTWHLFYNNP